MNAEYKKLMKSLQAGEYAPFYLIDGEESFYLDLIVAHFEDKILTEAERDFNLITLYGRDTEWTEVVNACRRFPMFAEKQVVIVKDAAQMDSFTELSQYLDNPAPTTILLIEHRFKKADGKKKVVKKANDKGLYFTFNKVKDEAVPGWIQGYGKEVGLKIGLREAQALTTALGNDLKRIANEIEKVRINIPGEQELTSAHIQKFIGISRDYNLYEFPKVIAERDKDRMYRMLAYFSANPKVVPIPLLVGSFYGFFNRLYQQHFTKGARTTIPLARIEYCLLIIAKYNNMGIGIGSNASNTELMREMVGKIEMAMS